MKIRLAILEKDTNYLNRIVTVFNAKYPEDLEVYAYSDEDAAINGLEEKKLDVFLASRDCETVVSRIPAGCGFAWLVDSMGIDRIDGEKAVCKFQKADLLYKQILSIYSEQTPEISGSNTANGAMKVFGFTSPVGGVGTSTAAAGCAIALAKAGNRVLFLSQNTWGSADQCFSCDGQFTFSDVVYAMKSNHTNRAMKLQSTVKQDDNGVFFYSGARVPLDMMEMSMEEWKSLLDEFRNLGCYDAVVMDMDYPRTRPEFSLLMLCDRVVLVSDGSGRGMARTESAVRVMEILDNQNELLLPRICLLLNHCDEAAAAGRSIPVLGVFPTYQRVNSAQLACQFALSDCYRNLM